MIPMTKEMNSMTTWHKYDWSDSCKQEFTANGTITLQTSFNAFVDAVVLCGQTGVTLIAMNVILPQTVPTNSTFIAMEYLLISVIVPKLALITEIMSEIVSARSIDASLSGPLNCATIHTHTKF